MKKILISAGLAGVVIGVTACSTTSSSPGPIASSTAPAAAASSAPAPSPVSTQAAVTGKCVTGLYDETEQVFDPLSALHAGSIGPNDLVAEAYQLTLTNTSSVAAEVTGFSVVLYDGSGDELTSDTQTLNSPAFIEPGQSLTWTPTPWGSYDPRENTPQGPYSEGRMGGIDIADTCQLAQWTHP